MNGSTHAPSHTEKVFDPVEFQKLVKKVTRKVKSLQRRFGINAIAACGNSGLLLAGAVGFQTGLPFFAVRKRKDTNNDWNLVNGFVPDAGSSYVILDDLISTGTTMRRIIKRISKEIEVAKPAAIVLYDDSGDDFFEFEKMKIPIFYT